MKDYSKLTDRIYTQLSPELSQEFHNMLTDMAQEISRLYEIENASPSKALEELKQMREFGNHFWVADKVNKSYMTIKEYILKAQEQEKEFDDRLIFENGKLMSGFSYKGKQIVAMPFNEYDKLMMQEKVLSIINESIKSKDGYVRLDKDYIIIDIGKSLNEEEHNLFKRYFENE